MTEHRGGNGRHWPSGRRFSLGRRRAYGATARAGRLRQWTEALPVECKYHLAAPADSCALDVADRGEHTMEEVGAMLGRTRERIRQIERVALGKIRRNGATLAEFVEHGRPRAAHRDVKPPEAPFQEECDDGASDTPPGTVGPGAAAR